MLEGGGYAAREECVSMWKECVFGVTESRREWSVEGPVEGRGGIGVCANEATRRAAKRVSVCAGVACVFYTNKSSHTHHRIATHITL